MDVEGQVLWDRLATCRGHRAAITAGRLARETGIGGPDGTAVRQAIGRNLEEFPEPVVANSMSEGGRRGYFVAVTDEEIAHYDAALRSRAITILVRRRTFRLKAGEAGFEREGREWSRRAPEGLLF